MSDPSRSTDQEPLQAPPPDLTNSGALTASGRIFYNQRRYAQALL